MDISTVGITVREALGKAMKLRKLAPETCKVYKVNDKVRHVSFLFSTYPTSEIGKAYEGKLI